MQRQQKKINFESKDNALMADQLYHINHQRGLIHKHEDEI